MDFFQENKKKKGKTPAQKLVLSLLIISIVLCIIIGIIMAYLSLNQEKNNFSISLNEKIINLNNLNLITTENGKRYISIKAICNYLGYDYYNGEFKKTDETKTKGYINNKTNIAQFFDNSQKIYKATENSITDYEYYNLDNPILSSQENLYIAIDDLDVAMNLIVNYSEKDNQIKIKTPEYWIQEKNEEFKNLNITISNAPVNLKALSYGYVVIIKDSKHGVITLDNKEIIGNKYNDISFCEYTKKFIVSNNENEYGVITTSGGADINLQYDSIEIINYEPLLYKVKNLEKYGIMKEDGSILNEIEYDSLGHPENKSKKINYTLIIPNLNENISKSIVVSQNGKYGLIDMENGKEIIPCILKGIYSVTKDEQKHYIVETEDSRMLLDVFINNFNRLTATVD